MEILSLDYCKQEPKAMTILFLNIPHGKDNIRPWSNIHFNR